MTVHPHWTQFLHSCPFTESSEICVQSSSPLFYSTEADFLVAMSSDLFHGPILMSPQGWTQVITLHLFACSTPSPQFSFYLTGSKKSFNEKLICDSISLLKKKTTEMNFKFPSTTFLILVPSLEGTLVSNGYVFLQGFFCAFK